MPPENPIPRSIGGAPADVPATDEFRDFFEHAAVALHWVAPDGTILRANSAELEMTGYRADEYVGRNIAEFHVDQAVIEDILRRLAAGETLRDHEARLRCKDGSIKDVLISSNVLRDNDAFVHTRCVTVDITDRKRAETRLAEYLGSIRHHFAAYDRDCRYVYVNPTAAEVLGHSADELVGRRMTDVFPDADGNQYHREMLQVLETGQPLASEHYYAPFDRWFMNYLSPTSDGVCVLSLDITEGKRAELGLRESEARKAAILEAALDCIITVDSEGRIIEFNPAAERTFGYGREDSLGMPLSDLLPLVDLNEPQWSLDRQHADSDGPALNRRIELTAFRADGTEFPAELAISPIRLDEKPLFTVHLRDITARKRSEEERMGLLAGERSARETAEEAVRARDELLMVLTEAASDRDRALEELQLATAELGRQREALYSLFMQAPVAICVIAGEELVFELANPAYVELVGGRDVVGKPLPEALPEAAGHGYEELLRGVLRTGEAVGSRESPVRLERNGVVEDTYFSFIYAPLRNPQGVTDRIVAVVNEVTEQVRARQAVEAAQARLEAVLDQMPSGVLIAEAPSGRLVLGNGQMERIIGRSAEAADISEYDAYIGLHPDGRRYLPEEWPLARSVREGAVIIGEELEIERDSGERVWISVSSSPVRDSEGRVVAAVATFDDVTDRKRSQVEREQLLVSEQAARDRAEEALALRDQFLSIAAHELRTPLAAIKGTAQLANRSLSRGRLDEATSARHLRSIVESSDRLQVLLDDLLDVSRMRREGPLIHRQPVELVELASAVVQRYAEARGDEDRVTATLPRYPVVMEGDPSRLEQVLDNLLSNAVKYSPDDAAISVRLAEVEGAVLLTVSDSGIGLPPGQEELIFQPFGRATNAAEQGMPGLGLGLYICRQIVEAHGGRLWAESAGEGLGTEMHVWLPAGSEPTSTLDAAVSAEDRGHARA